MIITDEMIHQALLKNGIAYLIVGILFLIGGVVFGYFFEKERRKVIDVRDRKARLVVHILTAFLCLAGIFFIAILGGRWLRFSNSYNVYETTVADKKVSGRINNNTGKNDHKQYRVYFEGISTIQVFSPSQKEKYDKINIGDRALVIDGIGNSYLKVYYDNSTYEGNHMVELK